MVVALSPALLSLFSSFVKSPLYRWQRKFFMTSDLVLWVFEVGGDKFINLMAGA